MRLHSDRFQVLCARTDCRCPMLQNDVCKLFDNATRMYTRRLVGQAYQSTDGTLTTVMHDAG